MSDPKVKLFFLHVAEVLDALRMAPRMLLFVYGTFILWYIEKVTEWYMTLPVLEQTTQNATFVSATITAVVGAGGWYAKVYTSGAAYKVSPPKDP